MDPTPPTPTVPPPPSWLSAEHLQTILKQVLTLATLLGILNVDVGDGLYVRAAQFIAVAFVFGANAWTVVSFIKSQQFIKGVHFNFLAK